MENKDEQLWKIAVKRAAFKRHLGVYLIMNAFFWLLWLWSGHDYGGPPWPIWPMLGWGIGIAFNYFEAYHGDKQTVAEKEYEKLMRDKK